jgi:hypothetical protein
MNPGGLATTGFFVLLTSLVLVIAIPAHAVVPPMSEDQLTERAELIATGYVDSVTEHDEVQYPVDDADELSIADRLVGLFKPRAKLVTAIYTITMEVEHVDKGELPPGEHQIQFRGFQNVKTPEHWMGGADTLRLHLQPGDTIKVYLDREGDKWALFHHMGIWLRG